MRHLQQAPGVEVEHRLRLRLVSGGRVIAAQHENIAHAEGDRAQKVALKGDPVAIAAGELEHRLDAVLYEEVRRHQARQVHFRARAVGDVHGGRQALERQRVADEFGRVGRHRRRKLGGDYEPAASQAPLELARLVAAGCAFHFKALS